MISLNKLVSLCWHPSRLLLLFGAAVTIAVPALTQTVPTLPAADLTSGQFTTGCGNATAAPIFNAALMNSGLYGENNLIVVSDPDIVLINNQWWMIFATGPTGTRAIQPFAAYLPPGASLSTTTTYPSDPNGWHLVGAQSNGQGQSYPVYPYPGTNGWDQLAAETPSVNVGPDGSVSVYYSGHNAGQTPFQIGLMTDFSSANGTATGDPNPVLGANDTIEPLHSWEYSAGLPALLEQSARWIPALNKFIMYYTAGAWWASPAPDNDIAYAESTDGINWVNRQHLGFPVAYYNQDFLYNEQHHRFEMVISHDRTGAGGGNPRDIVWRESATPATTQANWVNEQTLLLYSGTGFISSGILSPSMKYGNLPGEENRLYVFFHSYDTAGNMYIGRFYCDATPSATPTFSLSQSNPAVSVVQGGSATMTFGVNQQSGFAAPVGFSVSGVPAGVTATLSQTSSTTGTSLNIAVPANAAPGHYPIVVTGKSGSITQTSTFTMTIKGPPTFSIVSSTSNLSLAPGTGSTMTITVTPQNGFTGTVNLSTSGFPTTVNNSLLSAGTTTGSTLVVYVQPATTPGKYPITVTGTSGGLTETTNFTLTVTGSATFTLTPSATAVSATVGSATAVNVAVGPQYGFTGAVTFSASGFPAGVTGTFQPASSATATALSIAVSSMAAPGQYPITVTGTSGTLSQTTSFTLSVAGPPTFGLTPSVSAVSATVGYGTTVNIAVSPHNGFTGVVNFSATGFPSGVTGTFQPPSSATTTTLSIAASSTAAPGQYPITVTGISGTLTQTTSFTLSVAGVPGFSLAPSVTTVSQQQGTGTTVNIGVTPQNGFSGSVTFSASGFPAGVNNTFLPTSSTTGSTLTLYVQPTVAVGNYPITVTGTSGTLTQTTTFMLTVLGVPGFSLTPSASAVSTIQGSGTLINVAVNQKNGFTNAVSFGASGFPSGVTGTFQPASSATATALSIATSSNAAPGQYPITVTGSAGTQVQTTTFTLNIAPATPTPAAPAPNVGYVAYWGITNSGITISWSTDIPSDTVVSYGTTPALGQATPDQTALTNSHGVTLTGLASGTTYYFVAQSTANGVTGYSTTYSFTTAGSVGVSPNPVITNVLAGNLTTTSATITWSTDQATNSLVNYGTGTSYGSSLPGSTTLAASHSVTLTGLTPGTTYDFDVVSTNAAGHSVTSPNSTFTTLTTGVAAPNVGYVAAWGISSSGATVTWSTDVPASTQLAYGTTGSLGQLSPLQTTLSANHGVTLTGLTSGTTYYFVAQSTGANGATGYSTVYQFTTTGESGTQASTPPNVGYVAFWGLTSSGITISWSTDVPATTQVSYGTTNALGQTSPVQATLTASHGVTLTGLTPNTTYYFEAQSTGADGATGSSAIYSFTTGQ